MIEVVFHGRGGQGVVTAAQLLARAVSYNGRYSQSFPFFGVERRGAPVQAFCRIDKKPIRTHEPVSSPDYVVVLDASILDYVDVCSGMKRGGVVLVNSHKTKEEIKTKLSRKDVEVKVVDATTIAFKHLGAGVVNTAMLGSFLAVADWVSEENIKQAVRETFKQELAEKNILAMKECYRAVV